jgi:enoyl-CoA hydratase/carnithine racemase
MDHARQLAATIAELSADAVSMTKELALRGLGVPLEQSMRLYHSYMSALEGGEEQLRRTGKFADSGQDEESAG